ncbi:MAG TPA: YqcC family protein [Actinomycetota bacterium]|nr:YqcC family protein [Actinomycetota bacterium]
MDAQLYEWMEPTIEAVRPYCDEPVIAAGTFQVAGGWASGVSNGLLGALVGSVFGRTPKHVRRRAGGLPETVIVAVGQTKVFVFEYRTRRLELDVRPPVRVWFRDDLVVHSDPRMVASKLTIDVASTGDHHELESTSMTGRLGKITREIFRLLAEPSIGERKVSVDARPPSRATKKADAKRKRLGELADGIEAELRRLGWWMEEPPSENTVLAGGAFGMETVAFSTWLQVVFVQRLRQAAAGEFPVPSSSSVSTMAAREFDGYPQDTDALMDLLFEVDKVVKSGL